MFKETGILLLLLFLLFFVGCGPVPEELEDSAAPGMEDSYPISSSGDEGGYPERANGQSNPPDLVETIDNLSALNGRLLYQSDQSGTFHIYLKDNDGVSRILTGDLSMGVEGTWSPDGQTIAFVTQGTDSTNTVLYLMDADGQNKRALIQNQPRLNWRPTWAHDGSQLLFVSNRDGNFEIYRVNSDGSNVINFTSNSANDSDPDWSPDGTQILFTSDRSGGNGLYKMNSEGGNVQQLLSGDWQVSNPRWSPGGTEIVFSSYEDATADIYVMTAAGNDIRKITSRTGDNVMPAWSGDGRIIFSGDFGDETYDLFMVDVEGLDLVQLTGQPIGETYSERYPRWVP